MSQTTELLLKIRQQGGEQLTRLQNSLKNLGQQSNATNVNFRELANELKNVQQNSVQSINNLRGYATAWREIANSVKIGSAEFKQATAEAARLDRQLQKTQGRGGRLRGVAQTVGTVAGAGVFGGPEGAIGATIGAIGGVPGAIAGGAIGAQLGGLRQQAGVIGETVAELNRYRIALAGVSQDQRGYEESVASITNLSRQFLLPLTDTTQQYTKLQASIAGAGFTANETDKVFRGIAAAITATGGTAEDLNSALRATSQVFSKGKVSAEELRQQIGERLPGAFTIFAQSIDKTPEQLDKALEKGEVSLEDFLTFSEELFARYGKTAEILADAPENAGRRLKVALDEAAVNYGGLFQIIGAGFQNSFAQAVTWANDNSKLIKQYVTNWVNAAYAIGQALGRILGALGRFTQRVYQFMQANPGVALANSLGGFLRNRLGIKQGQGRFKPEDLFPEFKPTSFGTGLGSELISGDLGAEGGKAKRDREAEKAAALAARLLERRNELTRRAGQLERELNEKILETNENINSLGANALQVFERKYIDKVSDAQKATGDLLLKVFKLAQEFQQAGGKLDTTGLVRGVMNLEEAALGLAQGEYAQNLNKFLTSLDEKFAAITERVYENAKAMQYNADIMGGLQDGFRSYADSVGTTREAFANLAENGMKTVEQAIVDLATTGTANYAEFATAILRQTSQMIVQQFVLKSIMTALGFIGGGTSAAIAPLKNVAQYNASGVSFNPSAFTGGFSFAMGGIMTEKGPLQLKKYAAGGIAYGPQLAMFGEGSRPEAYVPLPDGRSIPVTMKGGAGATNVTVNVDASGTFAQGNQGNARQLGVVVAAAVQAELVKQKRPGGLLA